MEYKLYKGYILGPGYQNPAYGIYETDIFRSRADVETGGPFHTSESDWEAELWVNSQMAEEGAATQADVDELNRQMRGTERNRVKEGLRLLVVGRDGKQLFAMELGDWNAYDFDSQREVGQAIAEGLPDEAYK